MRYHGHAKVDPRAPSAFAVCDRCGMLFNLDDLRDQHDWQGARLANLHLKVCQSCTDKPFEHHRAIILPADPVPRRDPRPEAFDAEMNDDRPTPAPTGQANQ